MIEASGGLICRMSLCFWGEDPPGKGLVKMDAYRGFAAVYDEFMDNIPYEEVAEYLNGLLVRYGVKKGLLLELGCGTGQMTRRMAGENYGYDMIGVDSSFEMLTEAKGAEGEDSGILYLLQDMREFELYGTVAGVYAVTDTMNYITEAEDFIQVLKLVNNYLDPHGVFVFDLKTEFFFREVLRDETFVEHHEDASLVWENTYDEEEKIHEYAVTVFRREKTGNLFSRQQEFHYQRAYAIEQIRQMCEQAGMIFEAAFEAYTLHPAQEEENDRIYFVLRENGKDAENGDGGKE